MQGAKPGVHANVSLENVEVVFSNENYTGFQHTGAEYYKDCTFVGQPFLYGENVVFDNCTFKQTSADAYNVWTYGAKNVTFNGCTFESAGKAVLVYSESRDLVQTVTFNDCVLNASAPVAGKAAIEIDSSLVSDFTVNINNTVANDFGFGSVSCNSLWNEKKGDNCTVNVDGVEQGKTVVTNAAGFKYLATVVLADGSKNITAELANDIDLAGIEWPAVKTSAAFVLDGKGHAIKNLTTSAVEDHGFYSTALFTSTRKATTIKNLVVENAAITGKGGDNSHGAFLVACNYADLTISGVTVKNSQISNCDRTGGLVTYLYFKTANVENCVVEGCTINSIGTAGAVLGMNNGHNFTMKGCNVVNTTVSSSEGNNKAGIFIGTWQNAGTLTSEDNTHSGSKAINAGVETNNEIGRHA
jgi:hypothetical protein